MSPCNFIESLLSLGKIEIQGSSTQVGAMLVTSRPTFESHIPPNTVGPFNNFQPICSGIPSHVHHRGISAGDDLYRPAWAARSFSVKAHSNLCRSRVGTQTTEQTRKRESLEPV
jgi:hypothetical protein